MHALETQRQKEREDDMARRRYVNRLEADTVNRATLKRHEREKVHAAQTKARFGRQSNSYAPESLRLATFGDQITNQRAGSRGTAGIRGPAPLAARDMPNATGVKMINPERLTTMN